MFNLRAEHRPCSNLVLLTAVTFLTAAPTAAQDGAPDPVILPVGELPQPGDVGPEAATTVQLPTFGIAVDARGVLTTKVAVDRGGLLNRQRVAAARQQLPGDVFAPSKLRKISLVRLERAVKRQIDAGRPLDEIQRNLAGLLRVRYVFYYPKQRDIVIAGPAEGWVEDASGRTVGITTRRPTMQLEDLVVALRTFRPGTRDRPFVGCTIDPPPAGLARLQKFQRSLPRSIPQAARQTHAARVAHGMQQALGMADVRVFGISPATHMGNVMIEADYRMKRIGIGLEPPPVKMRTFIGSIRSPKDGSLQRWWFTPNYQCVRVAKDGHAMELVGHGVQLQGEDKTIGPGGRLLNPAAAKQSPASGAFTESFTKNYIRISAVSPVYGELRNAIDLLVAAAYIRARDFHDLADWKMDTFLDEQAIRTQRLPVIKRVQCVANSVWRGNRMYTPAGGGVSIQPLQALRQSNLLHDEDGRVAAQYGEIREPPAGDSWWWD